MYESAHFISSRMLSGFRDFPMPDSYPDYPGHALVLAYLSDYAERHRLLPLLRFGGAVRGARPARGGLAAGRGRRDPALRRAGPGDGPAVVAEAAPHPGPVRWRGVSLSAYHSARQLDGKRVLVVGGGNSGCDIAADAGSAGSRAFLSLRRGYWFIPKHVFGTPADVFGSKGPHLPHWIEQPLLQGLLRLLVGDVTRLGLPAPDHRLFETHPVLNSQILHSLSHGDVTVKGDVKEFRGRHAVFADGSEEELDVVIFATGYRRAFPIVPESVHREGDVSQLFLNLCHRAHPNLFLVGFFETDGGAFPLIDLQAELLAKLVAARARAPEKAARFEWHLKGPAPDFSDGVRFLEVERMRNYVRTYPYTQYLKARIHELTS